MNDVINCPNNYNYLSKENKKTSHISTTGSLTNSKMIYS